LSLSLHVQSLLTSLCIVHVAQYITADLLTRLESFGHEAVVQ